MRRWTIRMRWLFIENICITMIKIGLPCDFCWKNTISILIVFLFVCFYFSLCHISNFSFYLSHRNVHRTHRDHITMNLLMLIAIWALFCTCSAIPDVSCILSNFYFLLLFSFLPFHIFHLKLNITHSLASFNWNAIDFLAKKKPNNQKETPIVSMNWKWTHESYEINNGSIRRFET